MKPKRENLTDKEKIEIEEKAEEMLSNLSDGHVDYYIQLVVNIGFWIMALVFLLIFPIVGIVLILVGIFSKSSRPSYHLEKAEQAKRDRKEKLIKELSKKVLNGEEWK